MKGLRLLARPALADTGLLTVATALALFGFDTVYSGRWYLFLGLTGFLLGAVLGHCANLWRWPVSVAVLCAPFVLVLGAGPLVVPETTIAGGVVPGWATITTVYDGAVGGWWGLLTTLPPVTAAGSLAVVPFLGGMGCGLAGILLSRHSSVALAPALAPSLLLFAGILFGTAKPASLILQGAVFSLVVLMWTVLRHRRTAPPPVTGARLRSRLVGATGIIGIAVVAAFAVGISPVAAVGPGDRFVLREQVEPPFDPTMYPSPLSAYRRYEVAQKDKVLFTVAGLPDRSRLRLAVMDDYDGVVWTVAGGAGRSSNSGVFQRVGAQIPTVETGRAATVTVTLRDLGGVWLPTAGAMTDMNFAGPRAGQLRESFRYNRLTGAGVLRAPSSLRSGDVYTFGAVVPATPENAAGRAVDDVTLPDLAGVPDEVSAKAIEWSSGAGGAQAMLDTLAKKFKDGAFSDGTTAGSGVWPGHGAARVREFLGGDELVGDGEQYAATFALMARELGLPARVVLGVIPPSSWDRTAGPTGDITGGDVLGSMVSAWVEVRFSGVGWISFDPTPPVTNKPKPPQPRNDPDGTTEVVEPPVVVAQPPAQQPPPGVGESGSDSGSTIFGRVLRLALLISSPILVLGSLALLVIGFKARRRRQRRKSGTPRHRVAGGWQELLDRLRDHGVTVAIQLTRREAARELYGVDEAVLPVTEKDQARKLAHRADACVYGPDETTAEQVRQYWTSLDHAIGQLGRGRPWWLRLLARVNPATLLPWQISFRRLLEVRR